MRRFILPILAMFALSCAPLAAEETRVAPKEQAPPPATLAQMDWLVGQWTGTGIGDALAHESWLPPTGGTMVGTFVQEDGDNGIRFTEHLYLMEEDGSLVLRLKHFNADLTGWEEKDDMLTFRLIAIEDGAVYFHGLTLRRTGKGLLAAVRMKSNDDEVRELMFSFRSADEPPTLECDDDTTFGINDCLAEEVGKAVTRKNRYLEAARTKADGDEAILAAIEASEKTFEAYAQAECSAVWKYWKEGTIRTSKALVCRRDQTDRRTHTIWRNWLTYPDSTAPDLPQPRPGR